MAGCHTGKSCKQSAGSTSSLAVGSNHVAVLMLLCLSRKMAVQGYKFSYLCVGFKVFESADSALHPRPAVGFRDGYFLPY